MSTFTLKSLKNKKIINIIKYIFIFLGFLIFFNAKLNGIISPFAPALLFALVWCNQQVVVVSLLYVIAQLVFTCTIQGIILSISCVAILLLLFYFHKLIKKPMNLILIGIYFLISQIAYFYFNFGSYVQNVNIIIYAFIGILFLYALINILQTYILRGVYYKLTLNEGICFVAVLEILSLGLASVEAYSISLNKIVAIFFVLFLLAINKSDYAIKFATAFGIGMALFNFELQSLAVYVLLALSANIFAMPSKYKACAVTIAIDVVLQLYFVSFEVASLTNCISTLIACSLFLLMPNNFLYMIADKFYLCQSEISMRNVINITRKNLHKKMQRLSDIFFDMKAIHTAMVKDSLSKEQVTSMLCQEIMQTVCADCLNKNKCHRTNSIAPLPGVLQLVEVGITKGRVTLLDLPPSLTSRCQRANALITKINMIVGQYGKYNNMLSNVNNVKTLLAEQTGAVAKLLLGLGDEIDKNVSFDVERESKIMNKLLSENIVCSEVLLYIEKEDEISAILVVKGENAYNPILPKIVTEVLKIKMKVEEVLPTENLDFMTVVMTKQNKYDVVFGLASRTKNESDQSGDCHSLLRLSNNKFLLALCDGMGSGEAAQKMSALTIGLIENFYKAGFDNETILQSVNKLLAINSQEAYSTLDICVLDLDNCLVDFIKVGAPYGLLKHENSVEKIEGCALPIGVLDIISPSIYKSTVCAKDLIIMATDGVTDAFKDIADFENYVNGINSLNPQTIAQTILDEAIFRNDKRIKDDMTVLIARTYLTGK